MNRNKKIWLGVLAFSPIIIGLGSVVYMFTVFMPSLPLHQQFAEGDDFPIQFFSRMAPFFIIMLLSIVLQVSLIIYFCIHAFNNKAVKQEERVIWLVVFILASSIAMPVYWILRIWPEPKPETNFVKM
ncbi:hypothetical protein PDL71_08600 [Lacibacter sp. MH-610]|uniref:hypothetical protein n=1 Tax=Lacibacter sp. MH-610 TaxID=3020883 RepID=UPI003892AFD2